MINICVVGWYLYKDLYSDLEILNDRYDLHVVSHKDEPSFFENYNLKYSITENIGLEFGAYDYYLKNIWDKESNVLFMHDDVNIKNISIMDRIAKINVDQAYLFKNKEEEEINGGKHGRCIFMSAKLLNFMLNYKFKTEESYDHKDTHNDTILKGTGEYTGFWYDPNNTGHTVGKPPVGVRHYNEMIYTFHTTMGRIRDRRFGNEPMNVVNRLYFPEIDCARRGEF